jgi:thiosulfate/3-mercaptopyruvate sulfurtransferase
MKKAAANDTKKKNTIKGSTVTKVANTTTVTTQLPIVCSVDVLRSLIRKKAVRVVDVRRIDDYKQSHIPTAVSLPLARILENDTPEKIVDILKELGISDNTPVVIYDDTFGALAARVAWAFQYVGHSNTALLEMTFKQWKEMGLETENKMRRYPKTKHSLNINKQIYADASYVESAVVNHQQDKKNLLLIDSRERLNFLTEHIPSAKNIPYTMVGSIDNNGGVGSILRTPEELRRMIENRGISKESEIITYCGSVGTLSGLTYYALKLAGFEKVKLYPKSFKEWKSLGKPKEEFKDATYWDLSAE